MTAAVLVGPVAAVMISMWSQSRDKARDHQKQTMRMLVSTRHLPGDPAYSTAINMIPIDFNGNKKIMQAWREYVAIIAPKPEDKQATPIEEVLDKQANLIFLILKKLGYSLSKQEIMQSAYASDGLITRDNLMVSGWRAWDRIAVALETQNAMWIEQSKEN